MSEQTSTPQVEETVPVQQPEAAAPEVVDASNKVVEPEKKPQEEVNKAAEAVSEEVVQEKPTSEVSTEKEVVESSEVEKKDQVDDSNKADKVVEEKSEETKADDKPAGEQPAKEEVVSEATNGDGHNDKKAEEPVAEETNGVCKRKAENGAEVVEDEKSPKKAKVVDDGDQAPVEETAA